MLIQENNGTGKTYSAVKFCIEQKLENDYQIITNVKSFKTFSDTIYMDNIFSIIQFCEKFKENGDNGDKKILIFFDEIFTIMTRSQKMAKEIGAFLAQMRKRKIIFITTAQEWRLIPIEFRLYVRYQVSCNMFAAPFTSTALLFNSINDGETVHWDEQLQDFTCDRISANFSKGNIRVIEAYDTYETIGS